jgi:glycosyltransferase involved in cell wall biosynthesis
VNTELSDRPLISIVIPTRERVETLRSTLATVLDQQSNRIEIVVADNASSDGTREFVASIHDSRLRYINSGRRLSMSANWELALEHALGDYIVIIGDDDAFIPGAVDRLIDDVGTRTSDVYVWPKHTYVWPSPGRDAYVERLAPTTSPGWLDLLSLSRFVLRMGGWRYSLLPSMYHSLVARRIPDAIREKHGRVYHTAEPDVFMMICIPAFTPRAWDLGYAVTAHGRSPKSNGWAFTVNEEPVGLMRFLAEYGDYELHPTLYPGIPRLANLTADTLLRARDMFIDHYGPDGFGYDAMWAYICREASVFKWHVGPWDVIRQRKEIGEYHKLSLTRFAAFLALQAAAEARARFLRRTMTSHKALPDIAAFVREIKQARSLVQS